MRWEGFIGHLLLLTSLLITAAIVLSLKWFRRRSRRRSPLQGKQIGHLPGQQLLSRIDKEDEEAGMAVDLMMMAAPILALVWATLRIDWTRVGFGIAEAMFVTAWAGWVAYGAWKYQQHARKREQAQDGLLAERVTGMQLNRLVAQGCLVLHDLPFGDFNIDHVVISPRGVFAVETKSFRKPKNLPEGKPATVSFDGNALRFPDFSTSKPIEQARRQAKSLASYLREALGEAIPVQPAVALPGWWIEKTATGKTGDTFVFTPMGRGCEWFVHGTEHFPPAKRSLLAQALAMKYPTITD